MRKVAKKMATAPSEVSALPMTGMVDMQSMLSYM